MSKHRAPASPEACPYQHIQKEGKSKQASNHHKRDPAQLRITNISMFVGKSTKKDSCCEIISSKAQRNEIIRNNRKKTKHKIKDPLTNQPLQATVQKRVEHERSMCARGSSCTIVIASEWWAEQRRELMISVVLCVASKNFPNCVDLIMREGIRKTRTATVKEERRRWMAKGRRKGEEEGEGSTTEERSRGKRCRGI